MSRGADRRPMTTLPSAIEPIPASPHAVIATAVGHRATAARRDGPSLQLLHRAGRSPNDSGDLLDAEVGDDAERQHLTLVRGKSCQRGLKLAERESAVRVLLGRGDRSFVEFRVIAELAGSPCSSTRCVDHPCAGNGERESTDALGSAGDGRDAWNECDEHVLHHGFGIIDTVSSQVAQHRRGEGRVNATCGVGVAALGRGDVLVRQYPAGQPARPF